MVILPNNSDMYFCVDNAPAPQPRKTIVAQLSIMISHLLVLYNASTCDLDCKIGIKDIFRERIVPINFSASAGLAPA